MSAKLSHSASLPRRRVAGQHPQDETQKENVATLNGKSRIIRPRKTDVFLPREPQGEEQREYGVDPTEQSRSRPRPQTNISSRTQRSLRAGSPNKSSRLRWGLVLIFALAAITISYSVGAHYVSLLPPKPAIGKPVKPPVQVKGLVRPWPIARPTDLDGFQFDCASQVIWMSGRVISDFGPLRRYLPPTWLDELLDLEAQMSVLHYDKHRIGMESLEPSLILDIVVNADEACAYIDTAFKSYQLDQFRGPQALLSGLAQDTINQVLSTFGAANLTESRPFLSSYERAALFKAKAWSFTAFNLSRRANETLVHLASAATGPFATIQPRLLALATDISNARALAAQPPPPTRFKAFINFLGVPPLVPFSARVNFTAAHDVVTDTILVTKHFLHSVDAAIAIVTKLQRLLENGPWLDAHLVTHQQWLLHEKEVRKWRLGVRECLWELSDYTWKCETWAKFHYLDKREVFTCPKEYEEYEPETTFRDMI